MKASDIVLQLAQKLPLFSERFTDELSVDSISAVGGLVTVVTSGAHGLTSGIVINISGVLSPLEISSLTRNGTVGTLELNPGVSHDFTENIPEYSIAILSGSNEAEFNGTFNVLNVPNRNTITFEMTDTGPTVATGSSILQNGFPPNKGYNGYKSVNVVDATSFTYSASGNLAISGVLTNALFRTTPRISATVSLERILESYTKQLPEKCWLFVVLGDTSSSKDRQILSDATSNTQRGSYLRQQIIESVNIYVVVPTTDSIAGRKARDIVEDEFKNICKSLLFKKFPTGFYEDTPAPLQFVSHGFIAYNTAFYIHGFTFEQVANLYFEDSVGYSEDVAFRDLNVEMFLQQGTQEDSWNSEIDLDDDPL